MENDRVQPVNAIKFSLMLNCIFLSLLYNKIYVGTFEFELQIFFLRAFWLSSPKIYKISLEIRVA